MSAWLVSKEHVDVVVTAAISLDVIEEDQATATGEILWQENVKSLGARYEERAEGYWDLPAPGSYIFASRPVESLFYVYHQVGCYNYQACEDDDYRDSAAYGLVLALRLRIEQKLGLTGDEIHSHPETNKATWGVEVKEDGQLWLDATEYWAWYETQRPEQVV